jgi:DNA repair photolyase
MPPEERLGREESGDHSKYRRAAKKAWRKIRTNKRVLRGKGSTKLEEYVRPSAVSHIIHPEILSKGRQVGQTSYGKGLVNLFHKTPAGIACGPFWELRWAFGCPLDCNYCYLRGTMEGKMKPRIVNANYVLSALDTAFSSISEPSLFNSGELADSLMNPSVMATLADRFEQQKLHKLITLSKFGPKNVRFLVEKPRKQTICAWSINAQEVANRWERAAAPPDQRIEAARAVSEVGYDTRIRIDPMFPIEDWKQHYQDLIYRIFEALTPQRIILGTPRGLFKTIKYARESHVDMSWADFFQEDSGWGKKLAFDQRLEMYSYVHDKLQAMGFDRDRVTLCKETVDMWSALGRTYEPGTCNCYGPRAYQRIQ